MFKKILLAGVAVVTSLTFAADHADAFGGRGYARRQARRIVHHAYHAPVAVHRVHVAPVVGYYRAPVLYPTPVYYPPAVSVDVGRYGSYYGSGYYGSSYYSHRGVSVSIGW